MEFFNDTSNWVLISFLIFAVFAFRAGKPIFLNMLDDRIDTIRKDIETAENLRTEAQELLAQYERKQRDAQQEAERIIKSAKENASKIKKQAESDLDAAMARREEQLKVRLKRMEEEATQEIRAFAAELSVQATIEVINEKFDKKANNKLVETAIKDLGSQIN